MSINDLPGLSALRTRMQWHQERQRVLAENVSNSDTPNFKPRDLVEPKFDPSGVAAIGSMGSLAMMQTSTGHIAAQDGGGQSFDQSRFSLRQTRDPVVGKKVSTKSNVNLCHADKCLHVVRIERQGPFEKVARLQHVSGY